MAQLRWPTIVPLGTLSVTAAGTTVSLSTNCGSLGGQVGVKGDYNNPPLPGTPLRQLILTNTGAGNAFLLPLGKTASANPDLVIACIPAGTTVPIPFGMPFENGILPENYVLDGSAACTVYGCGIIS